MVFAGSYRNRRKARKTDTISGETGDAVAVQESDVYALVLGRTIAQLREGRGYSQGAFADRITVGQSSLSRFELGQAQPEPYLVEKIALQLGLSPSAFARCVSTAFERTAAAVRAAVTPSSAPWWDDALRVGGPVGVAGLVAFAVAATLTAEGVAPPVEATDLMPRRPRRSRSSSDAA